MALNENAMKALEFFKTKPANERFQFTNSYQCALAQAGWPGLDSATVRQMFGDEMMNAVLFNNHDCTFGFAVEYLEKLV